MKKKIFTGLTLLFLMINLSISFAQTNDEKEIQELKDKLETKVEELQKKNQKAFSGAVVAIQDNVIKIQSDTTTYQIKIDPELTLFYLISGSQKQDAEMADVEKGTFIIAAGPINQKTIDANTVYIDTQFIVDSGKVTEVNSTESYIRLLSVQNERFTIDIELATKKSLIDSKTLEIENTTIAGIKEGDIIHFAAEKPADQREKNRYSAQKILVVPQEYFTK